MKRLFMCCLVVWIVLGGRPSSQAQTNGTTENAIAALEQRWLESEKTNNPDMLAPLLADKFAITEVDGRVMNKTELLAVVKEIKYASAENEDLKVTVFGDTAIARGGFKATLTYRGKSGDSHERWTDTWVKMPSGKWQCVASHSSVDKTQTTK